MTNDEPSTQFPECPRCGARPGQAHDPTCRPAGDPVQADFEAAVNSGQHTIRALLTLGGMSRLATADLQTLQQMVWNLERITATVQREIDTRLEGPVDTA